MASKTAELFEAVRRARIARGLSQSALAAQAGISRQALSAVESGAYQPGVAVAIRLARALDCTVENLFSEGGEDRVSALMAGDPAAVPSRVALGRVGGRMVAIRQPAAALELRTASGIAERTAGRRADVATLRSRTEIDSTLLIAGCDPAVAILGDWLARHRAPASAFAMPCSSRDAMRALLAGRVHAAGMHIRDRKSGDYNLAIARRALGRRRGVLVNFAKWELGIAMVPGNPLGIRGVEDLARRRIRIVNREAGSGARMALDETLAAAGIDSGRIAGYERKVGGHLEVAAAIAGGAADAGVTIRVAADAYALGFIAIREERYDLVILERDLESAAVRAMMDALNAAHFARELSALCSYDTNQIGAVIARFG